MSGRLLIVLGPSKLVIFLAIYEATLLQSKLQKTLRVSVTPPLQLAKLQLKVKQFEKQIETSRSRLQRVTCLLQLATPSCLYSAMLQVTRENCFV